MNKIARALISVSDKTDIVEFASKLAANNIEILSTGGTASLLSKHNIPVTQVSDYTGFPEMMNGRIKTLHPKLHGGILARRDTDQAVMQQHGVLAIDLVVVNLYPFSQVTDKPDCELAVAIENIDIGGPTMVRAAAKNHQDVAIVVDTNDYDEIINQIQDTDKVDEATRFNLAKKAFAHTAQYDAAIAHYLQQLSSEKFAQHISLPFEKRFDLRYGENPHQQAAFYQQKNATSGTIASATQYQGKALSYNNIADADAALACVKEFTEQAACVIVKHANPCGVATGKCLLDAYQRAFSTDPNSSFGGIIAFNQTLDADTAKTIIDKQFVEVIIAPEINKQAQVILAAKPNVRVLATGKWQNNINSLDYKRVSGGLLVQDHDIGNINANDLKIVTHKQPTADQIIDALFAWKVVKHVKSNAIVYVKNGRTVGIGAGQMSRVYSARIGAIKAEDEQLSVKDSIMASDAFFPFRDTIDNAAKLGISLIIQPGGSIRDEEVIQAANEANLSMLFTGMRHFKH